MSLSSLVYFGVCYGCYKLGAFNSRHPGELAEASKLAWIRLCDWLKKSQ